MIALALIIAPILCLPLVQYLPTPRARLTAMQFFAALQHGLALFAYFSGVENSLVTSAIFSIQGLAGAFLVGYTGLQFVALLVLPQAEASIATLVGILLLSICTVLTITTTEPAVFFGSFVASLFIPFLCSFMERSDWRGAAVFLTLGVVCSLLVFIGSFGAFHDGSYHLNWWLVAAASIRLGLVPTHLWIRRMVLRFPLQWSILFFLSYPSVALLLPLHHPMVGSIHLSVLFHFAWLSVLYGAWLACVQQELRAAFYYLLVTLFGIIGVGLTVATTGTSISGVLFFWMSSGLAFAGFGLTIEMLETRLGELSINGHHGLMARMPKLGTLFLLFGLASIGFPGMAAFVGEEVMLRDIYEHNGWVVIPILLAMSLNGITVLRWFFALFYGPCTLQSGNIELLRRERIAFLVLLAIILGTGIFPEPLFRLGSAGALNAGPP